MTHVPVLPHAIALNPDATPEALTAAAAHTGPDDHSVLAALRAHPALPDGAVPEERTPSAPAAIDAALRLPHATATTRARVLAHVSRWSLAGYASEDPAIHPDVLGHLTTPSWLGPAARADLLSVLHHPALPPELELDTLRTLLSPGERDHLDSAHTSDVGYILTRATAYGADLADLAALADIPDPNFPDRTMPLRGDLHRYAQVHAAGHDPYATRIAEVTSRSCGTGTHAGALTWAAAIHLTGDPDIASAALNATTTDPEELAKVARAIRSVGRLRRTAPMYRALRHLQGKQTPAHAPDWVPTEADLLRATTRTAQERVSALAKRTHFTADEVHLAAASLPRAATPSGSPTAQAVRVATHLALHPDASPADRGTFLATLRARTARPASTVVGDAAAVMLRLASAPDLPAALLATPVTDLARTAAHTDILSHTLAQALAPILADRASDGATARALLTLEGAFPGTLAELLATARTISA